MSDPRDLSGVRAYPLTDGDRALIPFALGARGFRPMATGRRSSRVLSEVEKLAFLRASAERLDRAERERAARKRRKARAS